jgi:hypothetical protein
MRQFSCTEGSAKALRIISAPIPAGSPKLKAKWGMAGFEKESWLIDIEERAKHLRVCGKRLIKY